ncbi:MAG: hypothetical protein RBU21_08025, partial [FCB group bacterium]|nr:hypothetical protein [FCB group bacterium]
MTSLQDKSRGAALIVAILVLAILLIIVLSFFQASRQEVSIATNYRNATQADLLAEGGTAIAIAFLNHDRTVHPTVTSIDHAWKTYFNGAWAAGKPWLWKYGAIINTVKGEGNAVPEYDLDWWTATRGDSLGDALYIPRVDGTGVYSDIYNPIANPFVVNYPSGPSGMVAGGITGDAILAGNNLGPLQVDRFADWDNDEDGLRDSAWIPMPMDVFPDMPADEPGDGIDNDLDGVIDESNNGLDDDGDGIIDNEPAERALFVYWGGNDGLDNDGNGQIDEVAERKPFLTTPFPPLDLNGDGIFDVTTYPSISVQARNPETGTVQSYLLDPNRGSADVDRLDNDYNLVINDTAGIAYTLINANDPTLSPEEKANAEDINRRRQATGFHAVDANTYFPGLVPPGTVVTFSGEPVCELVGRAAILVKDENSKVNMNAAGGRNFRDLPAPDITNDEGALRRALGSGASTAEYETRVLPQIENATSDRAWNQRTGGFSGIGMKSIGGYTANVVPAPATYGLAALNFDVSLPGFGRVDDNGNALWMAMDGIDNDGDGQIDEGLRGFGGAAEEAWAFEGVDEPQEYQTYRPLRNRDPEPDPVLGPRAVFAESDGIDNSASVADDEIPDGSVDEIGELGDRYLRSTEQLKLLQEYAGANFDRVRNLVTVNGTDLNSRFQRYFPDGFLRPAPALSGPKLDYNYATTEQIFNAIFHDWGYLPQVPVPGTPGAMLRLPLSDQDPGNAVGRFAVGLRREDTAIYAPNGILGGAVASAAGSVFPAFGPDPLLRAAQLATNIRDNRDRNLGRSEVATSIEDNWFKALQGAPATDAPRQIQYAQAGFESIRINEIMARAVRRVEAEMDPGVNFLNPNAFSDPAGIPDFEMEVLEPDSATPEWTRVGSVLGERSYFRSILEEDDTSSTGIDESRQKIINVGGTPRLVPKMIEFRFAASPGLPSFQPPATGAADEEYMEGARYYLMLNTARINPDTLRLEPTVSSETRLKYVIKYGRDGEGIIDDLTDPNTPPGFNPFVLAGDSPIVGYRPNGAPTGFVFLSGTVSPSMDQAPVIDPAVPPVGFYNADEAYTVHIPPYRPADQVYLYVGIWFGDDDPETLDAVTGQPELALNFFDFSQEPDHEWIEIVNTATTGAPVNIEGWQLQVGADVMLREDGNSAAPALLTVPGDPDNPLDGDVLIAPGGSLLLGFNKYDPGTGRFNDPTLFGDVWLSKGSSSNLSDVSAIYRNGIALARGTYGNAVGTTVTGQLTTEPPIPGLDWATGNTREDGVFYRPTGDDFVDRNGDGIPEAGTPDDAEIGR